MQTLAATQPRPQHVMRMIDDFDLMGPNGRHKCLVLDLVGPNVPEFVEPHFSDGRLPGNLAKRIANQALIGLDGLHQHKIGHGGRYCTSLTFMILGIALNISRPSHSQFDLYDAAFKRFTRK